MRYVKKLIATCILVAVVGGLSGCGPKVPTMEEIKVKVFKDQEQKFWSLSKFSEDFSLLSVYAGQVGHAALAAYPDAVQHFRPPPGGLSLPRRADSGHQSRRAPPLS